MSSPGPASRRGRPPKIAEGWDPKTGRWAAQSPADRVLTAIRGGVPVQTAAKLARIDVSTLNRWLARGKKARESMPTSRSDRPYAEFCAEIDRVRAEWEAELVLLWRRAAQDDWRALERMLAKGAPEHWGDRSQVQIEHSGAIETGGETSLARTLLADDELREASLDLLKRARGKQRRENDPT